MDAALFAPCGAHAALSVYRVSHAAMKHAGPSGAASAAGTGGPIGGDRVGRRSASNRRHSSREAKRREDDTEAVHRASLTAAHSVGWGSKHATTGGASGATATGDDALQPWSASLEDDLDDGAVMAGRPQPGGGHASGAVGKSPARGVATVAVPASTVPEEIASTLNHLLTQVGTSKGGGGAAAPGVVCNGGRCGVGWCYGVIRGSEWRAPAALGPCPGV